MNDKLEIFRVYFRDFLDRIGVVEAEATLLDKVSWLESRVTSSKPPTYWTLRKMGRALRDVGPGSNEQRLDDYSMIRTFICHIRGSVELQPPINPLPAMLDVDFVAFISTFDPNCVADDRAKCQFLLARWAGLPECSINLLAQDAIEMLADDTAFYLSWNPRPHVHRRVLIPRAQDELVCPVRALRKWKTRLGKFDARALLFPKVLPDKKTLSSSGNPLGQAMRNRLAVGLQKAGIPKNAYDVRSIRRQHAIILAANLGEAEAIYRCGYERPGPFYNLLRGEPRWDKIPPNPWKSRTIATCGHR